MRHEGRLVPWRRACMWDDRNFPRCSINLNFQHDYLATIIFMVVLFLIFLFNIDGDVGIEGNSGSDGKSEWSEMVRACVEEGWISCINFGNNFHCITSYHSAPTIQIYATISLIYEGNPEILSRYSVRILYVHILSGYFIQIFSQDSPDTGLAVVYFHHKYR